jgi:hypothetical protein
MEPNIDQKRKMERFPVQLPASIFPAVEEHEEHREAMNFLTRDACAGGVFIQTDKPLPLGTEVKIELVLPLIELKNFGEKGALLKVSGAVVRVTETGMAIGFNEDYHIWPLPI